MNVHVWDASPDQEDIREGLNRELTRRWTKTAREVKRSILTHDALGIGEKAPQVAQPTDDKAEMFRRWLNERLAVGIGGYDGSWLEPFVRTASDRGAEVGFRDAVQAQLGFMVPGAAPSAKACHGATVAHLAGICEDVSQRAHDSVANGLLARRRPSQIARLVDRAMGHGLRRSRALAEHAVTQAYSQATLDGMEARGVTHVGTLSERKRVRDAFDPDEPRDPHGEWTTSGAGADVMTNSSAIRAADWMRFHKIEFGKGVRDKNTGRIYWFDGWQKTHAEATDKLAIERDVDFTLQLDQPTLKKFGKPHLIIWVKRGEKSKVDPVWVQRMQSRLHVVEEDPDVPDEPEEDPLTDADEDDEVIVERPDGTRVKVVRYGEGWAVIAMDAPRKNPQPKHPRSGRFAKAHVVAREMRRSKRTGQFRKQGVSAEEQRKEELAEARFGRVRGKLDILTAGDDRVCDVCDDISANGPYTINAARGLIPAHPNCRCVFVAAGSMKDALIDFDPSEPRDPLGMWTKTEGVVAYHGSGHDFAQFSMEHVGEGEGSQVFGHGLYLAEEPKVAEGYREAGLTGHADALQFPDGKIVLAKDMSDYENIAFQTIAQTRTKTIEGAIEVTQRLLKSDTVNDRRWAAIRTRSLGILQKWKEQGAQASIQGGNLYQVKIHATPDEFLDWDKPLSQQSKLVQDYVKNRDLGAAFKAHSPDSNPLHYDPTGEQMMRGFIGMGPKGAERLRAAGIKGVRYLDQGSRNARAYGKPISITRSESGDTWRVAMEGGGAGGSLFRFNTEDEARAFVKKHEHPTSNYVIVEPAIIEITHHNGKPLTPAEAKDAWLDMMADFDPDEPRDERGRWTSSGSVTPSSVHAGGEEFVSPSVETGLTFDGAKAALSSPRQAAMLKVSDEIDGALGLKETAKSVIGAWADGAENSVLATLPQASWDEIRLSAAMKGYVGDQKAVLAFKQDDSGDAFMYEMHAKGALDDIHHRLLNDGLAFHTLAPTADGADVYVADLDGKATEAIQRAAKDFHANATYQRGRAEFIGTQLEDGTDRAIRDDARRNYEGVIQQSPVSGGAEVWQRNRDRWSQALTGVRAKELIAVPPDTPPIPEGNRPTVFRPSVKLRSKADELAWGAEVRKRAGAQFEQDGYPARHLEVLSGTDANVLVGANYNTLAQYSPNTGKIQVFAEALPRTAEAGSANTVEGTVAHEIMHAKTDWWLKMNPSIETKMKDELKLGSVWMDRPIDIGRATPMQLMVSDGVTPYSREVWNLWQSSQDYDESRRLPFDLPFGETISDMRALQRETGELPGKPEWQAIYRDIEKEWKRAHAKNLNERLRA